MTHSVADTHLPDTQLYQLVYVSRITSKGLLRINTLNEIMETSKKNNSVNGITGILCYGGGYFFQYVEGSSEALSHLQSRLLSDHRHKNMNILNFSAISHRRFSEWSMRLLFLEKYMISRSDLQWAKKMPAFRPHKWQSGQWEEFISHIERHMVKSVPHPSSNDSLIEYNAFGNVLTRFVGQHQVFFMVQGFLLTLGILFIMFL